MFFSWTMEWKAAFWGQGQNLVYTCAPQYTSEWCHLQVYTLIMLIYTEKLFILCSLFQTCFWTKQRMQEDVKKKKEHKGNSGWVELGVGLWTFSSFNRPLRKRSVLSGAWTGRLHLEWYQVCKTKGCVFRLLPISPPRVLRSRVANVFTGDAGRVFLISYPLSLGDFLCVMFCLLCGENERKMCASQAVGSLYREVILTYRVHALQRWDIQSSLPCCDMKTISLRADMPTAPQNKCHTCTLLPGFS